LKQNQAMSALASLSPNVTTRPPSVKTSGTVPPTAGVGSPVPGLALPGKGAEKKTVAGRVLGMLTPRGGSTPRTPREPEEREITVCMVRERDEDAAADPLGVYMQGATVASIAPTSLAARWGAAFEHGLRVGDIILSVSDVRFEGGRPLTEHLKPGQRAYRVRVRRTVVPPRSDLSARMLRGLASIHTGTPTSFPETQEAMERALMEWEYFRPKDAHPEKDDSDDEE